MTRRRGRLGLMGAMMGVAVIWAGGSAARNGCARQPYVDGQNAAADPALVFQVHDYAHLQASTLGRVEAETTQLFREIGIPSRWETPGSHAAQPYAGGEENSPFPLIYVNILTAHMASQFQQQGTTLGYSVLPSSGEPATIAYVFYGRALETAGQGPAPLDELLAHAIAHEVGHLLLGAASHSDQGIMRAVWGPEDLARISQGRLDFDAQQSADLRAAVAARRNGASLTEKCFPAGTRIFPAFSRHSAAKHTNIFQVASKLVVRPGAPRRMGAIDTPGRDAATWGGHHCPCTGHGQATATEQTKGAEDKKWQQSI